MKFLYSILASPLSNYHKYCTTYPQCGQHSVDRLVDNFSEQSASQTTIPRYFWNFCNTTGDNLPQSSAHSLTFLASIASLVTELWQMPSWIEFYKTKLEGDVSMRQPLMMRDIAYQDIKDTGDDELYQLFFLEKHFIETIFDCRPISLAEVQQNCK